MDWGGRRGLCKQPKGERVDKMEHCYVEMGKMLKKRTDKRGKGSKKKEERIE